MKPGGRSFVELVGFAIAQKLLSVAILFGGCLVAIAGFALHEKYEVPGAYAVGGVVFLFSLVIAFFFPREVFLRMEEDPALEFGDAAAHTFYRYLMYASFLPIVGSWIARVGLKYREKNPFVADRDE